MLVVPDKNLRLGWSQWSYELLDADERLAKMTVPAKAARGGTIQIGTAEYSITSQGDDAGPFQMCLAKQPVAFAAAARHLSALTARFDYTIQQEARRFSLISREAIWKRDGGFDVICDQTGQVIGDIRLEPLALITTGRIIVDLAADIPPEARAFLVWVALALLRKMSEYGTVA